LTLEDVFLKKVDDRGRNEPFLCVLRSCKEIWSGLRIVCGVGGGLKVNGAGWAVRWVFQ
jgi:hypothetical protein